MKLVERKWPKKEFGTRSASTRKCKLINGKVESGPGPLREKGKRAEGWGRKWMHTLLYNIDLRLAVRFRLWHYIHTAEMMGAENMGLCARAPCNRSTRTVPLEWIET